MNISGIYEAAILALTLSIDAFIACFAYGSDNIKIPTISVFAINILCAVMLVVSVFIGKLIRPVLRQDICRLICFLILLIIGVIKLLDNITRTLIKKTGQIEKDIKFSFLNFRFVLNVYADPEAADADESKSISVSEAISIAAALSIDGITVGFGAALGEINAFLLVVFSVIANAAATAWGVVLGVKASKKLRFNVSWISGAVLIILAFSKIR